MSEHSLAETLLRKSEEHALAIQGMRVEATYFNDDIFGFHIQQQIELLLKAWIAWLGEQYPLTHDLEKLLDVLQSKNVQTASLSHLKQYTPYSVAFRYEEHSAEPLDRTAAVQHVEALRNRVQGLLEE